MGGFGAVGNPEKCRQEQLAKHAPEEFDEPPREEQQEVIAELQDVVVSYDPTDLRVSHRPNLSRTRTLRLAGAGPELRSRSRACRNVRRTDSERGGVAVFGLDSAGPL
jgi:hypothetical protein